MANIYGELVRAQLENLASAPGAQVRGRVFFRSDLLEAYLDNGTLFSQFLVNDQKIAIGTAAAASNVRVYRGGTGKLAFVTADDATAEASITSAKLAQLAFCHETYTDAAKPSAAIAGRTIYATDLSSFEVDSGSAWTAIGPSTLEPRRNVLLNAGFDLAQRGTVTIAANTSGYGLDRWYIKNAAAATAVITPAQQTGVTNGTKWGCQVKITTGAADAGKFELNQVLEIADSLQFYGATASFTCLVKAVGNVTQIGVQFGYAVTEAKLTTYLGAEQLVTISTAGFVAASILAQAMGTAQGTSGVVGIRIRATAVSSGNICDLNNGFIVEQPVMVKGASLPIEFQRATSSFAAELQRCQRFFARSYDLGTASATSTVAGAHVRKAGITTVTSTESLYIQYPVSMRAAATMVYYSATGASGKWRDATAAADLTAGTLSGSGGFNGVTVSITATTAGNVLEGHWTADAEI